MWSASRCDGPTPFRSSKTPWPSDRRNGLVHRRLHGEALRRLKDQARREQTTLHGALCAALLLAVTREVFAERYQQQTATTVGCFSAVNLRPELVPSVGEEMGLYISQVTTFHKVVPEPSLWALARESRQRLTQTLSAASST
jgi:hypothetical protein